MVMFLLYPFLISGRLFAISWRCEEEDITCNAWNLNSDRYQPLRGKNSKGWIQRYGTWKNMPAGTG